MKNRSLKAKLTLLYTVLMTLVILTALAVLLSLSGQALRSGGNRYTRVPGTLPLLKTGWR